VFEDGGVLVGHGGLLSATVQQEPCRAPAAPAAAAFGRVLRAREPQRRL